MGGKNHLDNGGTDVGRDCGNFTGEEQKTTKNQRK